MAPSEELERSQRAHSTAALATSFSPLATESATLEPVDQAQVTPQDDDPRSASASEPSHGAASAAATRPPGSLAQQGRSKSMTTSITTRSHYSSRGFEADPFERAHVNTTTATNGGASGTMHRSLSSFSSGALAAHEQGDWLERLGKRATAFGRWTTEHTSSDRALGGHEVGAPHGGASAGTRRSHHQRRHGGNGDEGDESTDEEHGLHISTSVANRDRPNGPTRNKSSLSVFHDPFETAEDPTLDFDYTSSQPTSPTPSRPRSRPSSAPTSPRTRMRRLESLPHSLNGMTPAQAEHQVELHGVDLDDPDVLAHQLLSAQDKLGAFSLVESVLEWPWSSSSVDPKRLAHKNRLRDRSFADPRTSEPPTAQTRALPVSRGASHHSLSHLVDDYLLQQNNRALSNRASKVGSLSSARMTPVGSSDTNFHEPVDVLNEGAWSETGELSAYYRAKSSGNLSGLRWEPEELGEEVGRELEKRVSSGAGLEGKKGEGGAGASGGTRPGIREGLGALLDTIGLGSFV